MTDNIATRVARGAALLDEKLPGWVDMIDLDRLDIRSPCRCVLGQTWHDKESRAPFFRHSAALFGEDDNQFSNEIKHGFNGGDDERFGNVEEYDALTDEWRRVILARRGEAA